MLRSRNQTPLQTQLIAATVLFRPDSQGRGKTDPGRRGLLDQLQGTEVAKDSDQTLAHSTVAPRCLDLARSPCYAQSQQSHGEEREAARLGYVIDSWARAKNGQRGTVQREIPVC